MVWLVGFTPGTTATPISSANGSTAAPASDRLTWARPNRGSTCYEQAIVPPGQYLIIAVALAVSYSYIDGTVSTDFASAAFDALCPFVQVVILPWPGVSRSPLTSTERGRRTSLGMAPPLPHEQQVIRACRSTVLPNALQPGEPDGKAREDNSKVTSEAALLRLPARPQVTSSQCVNAFA
ncbi:hypothetical protein [Paenarthrobacter sp. PH39-S1]|uniref:hypothetical protein n=1 Tax=Paenarthrobacter sp. PH39-S1 TaxID=3046204 RepID=UPI0024BADA21|nr:hypothetical protein [Paenarthrobacter sp. PH39-S1]MDJ0357458.1 hypothetical protein [Paenarthrobacter sp. PH39-S1]